MKRASRRSADTEVQGRGLICTLAPVVVFATLSRVVYAFDLAGFGQAAIKASFIEQFCGSGKECLQPNTYPEHYALFISISSALSLVGATFGSASQLSSWLAWRFGRRAALFASACFLAVGAVAQSLTTNELLFLLWRFVQGWGLGIEMMAMPMYIAEISPAEIRGLSVGTMQVTLVAAVAVGNWIVTPTASYAFALALPAIPACLMALGIFCIPESPRYVMHKYLREGKRELALQKAKACLLRLRSSEACVNEELSHLLQSFEGKAEKKASWGMLWKDRSIRWRLLVANLLQWAQQLTGMNAILGFMPLILDGSGIPLSGSTSAAIVSTTQIVFCLIQLYLVDKLGRRPLFLFTSAVMAALLVICSITAKAISMDKSDPTTSSLGWLLLACFICFTGAFQLGWGAAVWLYPTEIFPMHIKERAMSTVLTSQFGASVVLAMAIPQLVTQWSLWGTLLVSAAINLVNVVLVYWLVPETAGVALEDMESLFGALELQQKSINEDAPALEA